MLRIIVLLFFTLFTLNGQAQFWKKSRIAAIKFMNVPKTLNGIIPTRESQTPL